MRELSRQILCSALTFTSSLWAQDLNEALFRGDPKAAMRLCAERALQAKPTELAFMVGRGAVHLAEGETQKAEAMFAAAEGAHGKDGETYLRIARAWKRAGRMDMLPGLYRKLVAQDPGHEDALVGFVGLLVEGGFPKEAQECGEKLFAKEPKEWELHIPIGKAWLKAGQKEAAAEWFARAAAAGRKKEEMWRSLAKAVAETLPRGAEGSPKAPAGPAVPERPDKAFFMQDARDLVVACVNASRALVKDAPENESLVELGGAALAAGDRAGAEELLLRAAELGNSAEVRRLTMSAWLQGGYHPEGLAVFHGLRMMKTKDASALATASLALLRAGYAPEAEVLLDQAWKADPQGEALCEFASGAILLGHSGMAGKWFKPSAAQQDPELWAGITDAFLTSMDPSRRTQEATRPSVGESPRRWFMAPMVRLGKADKFGGQELRAFAKSIVERIPSAGHLENLQRLEDLFKASSPSMERIGEGDVILSLDEIHVKEVKVSQYGRSTWYMVTEVKLGLYSGRGRAIRNIVFLNFVSPGFIGGDVRGSLQSLQTQVQEFVTSPIFDLWAR